MRIGILGSGLMGGKLGTIEENTTDFIGILIGTVNRIRNTHAHGEMLLYPTSVWQTFEICADFINALFGEQAVA